RSRRLFGHVAGSAADGEPDPSLQRRSLGVAPAIAPAPATHARPPRMQLTAPEVAPAMRPARRSPRLGPPATMLRTEEPANNRVSQGVAPPAVAENADPPP